MYEVRLNGTSVGSAQIVKEGLYYKIHCCCSFHDKKIYRISILDGKSDVYLGICVPEGNHFVLTTRVPVKYLSGENWNFVVNSEGPCGVPVVSGKPFEYLEKLETARFNTNGQPKIVID